MHFIQSMDVVMSLWFQLSGQNTGSAEEQRESLGFRQNKVKRTICKIFTIMNTKMTIIVQR